MSEDTRHVAICGTAPATLDQAPFGSDEFEIWGTTRLWKQIGDQWDCWFELHPLERIGKGWGGTEQEKREAREEHIEWLTSREKPIYVQGQYADRAPCFQPYPIEEVSDYLEREFGDEEDYFTNSISYMLALAIYMDVDRIGVYGVDMAMQTEYESQRPSCEYLIGLARGAGIEVHVPDASDLLKTPALYGYESHEIDYVQTKIEARKDELETRKQTAENERHSLYQQRAGRVGQIQVLEEFVRALENGGPPDTERLMEQAEQLREEVERIEEEAESMARTEAAMQGALDDQDYMQRVWSGVGKGPEKGWGGSDQQA